MGGTLPMGYDVRERKLVINQDEARVVRERSSKATWNSAACGN
jgi:hypothetical protein